MHLYVHINHTCGNLGEMKISQQVSVLLNIIMDVLAL